VVRTIGVEALQERLRAAGTGILLPERLASSFPLATASSLQDLLPIGDAVLAIVRCGDATIATLVIDEAPLPRRVRTGDGAFAAIARAVAGGEVAGRFAVRRFGSIPLGGEERAIATDQSNDSVVVGDAAIVKLYPLVTPGPHPAVRISMHLDEVGFVESPRLLGALTWSDDDAEYLVATITQLLPEAHEGWDWHIRLVEEIADGERPPAAWARPAAALGALVARLHVALATASSVIPTPRSLASQEDASRWLGQAESTLEEALASTDGPEGERLRAHEPAIRASLAPLGSRTGTTITTIHGDLHVGQLLPWRDGFAVIDFEGNPLQPDEDRGRLRPPARDVASLVRSFDHVGRIVQRRRPDRAEDIAAWIAAARSSFLDAYRTTLHGVGEQELFDERLLRPFEVAQECHEYVYAARYLPHWRSVPDLALPQLLEEA
jgi:trehalose synthase-fused probable maltokinase